jgi:predicted site-specific integrase-resolvase
MPARPEDLISEKELAERFGRRTPTVKRWRWQGRAPPFYRVNGRIYYSWPEVEEWLKMRRES